MNITIGDEEVRRSLHAQYGGNPQSGISRSGTSGIIMCFTDPKKGALYGYSDGWGDDGFYHYTGEGQEGDQEMVRGNKAIRDHAIKGETLHLFRVVRPGVVSYRGQFELPSTDAWYRAESLDRNKQQRSVIVFRLKPCDLAQQPHEPSIAHIPASSTSVEDIPPEDFLTTRTHLKPREESTTAYRRESALLSAYRAHLEARGHTLSRKKITPQGERRGLYTDLYDSTENLLIEAKGQATRESIRMAIGQLFDYQRYIQPSPHLAVLVPSQPRKDLRDLCAAHAIRTIWPNESGSGYRTEPSTPPN